MNMIPTPGVIGVLQSGVPGSATTMTVDAAYATYLAGLLVSGAWTYAKTLVGNAAEVIKITGISGQVITVVRQVDNSSLLVLAAGALLEFDMCASAVADLINAASLAPALSLTSTDGSVTITSSGTNHFNLAVPIPALTSTDASIIVTSPAVGQYNVGVNTSKIGCCS